MKIRRSLAAAVFLATAAAPVAMGAAPAFADTAPAGHEQTDPAETKAAETKADEAKTDEANRAAIEKLLVYPNDYLLTDPSAYLREHAAAALAGTPADRAHFLAVEVDGIRRDDARIAIARIMNAAGPVLKKQCRALVDSDDVEALRAFLKTGQYVARAEDEKRAAEDDDRLRLSQIMSAGGPAVRKAAGAALDGSIEDVRAFLKTGQYVARAEDENRAEVQRILDDPNSGPVVREAAQKALAGSAADVEHFLKEGQFTARAADKAAAEAARGTSGSAQPGT
ncbi:ALF repeat-containing protein, partial [Kitasatospora sp. MBT63]|uniref:ALF repeat-containing protein n=1 Tax=Kitasatospora sp. MBT63 TaxID=1444768 RepID=UPI0011EA6AFD